jgi:hypothetical protein
MGRFEMIATRCLSRATLFGDGPAAFAPESGGCTAGTLRANSQCRRPREGNGMQWRHFLQAWIPAFAEMTPRNRWSGKD